MKVSHIKRMHVSNVPACWISFKSKCLGKLYAAIAININHGMK